MSTQQSGLVAGNKQNSPGGSTGRSRSKFPLSYSQFQTERFAEYFPFYVAEGVSSDKLPLHSNHEVQTYTLKSPILQSLSKKKDYFVVPMQAILPLNWEKFYTSPNIGQDVPDDCGLGVSNFWSKMRTLFSSSWTQFTTDFADTSVSRETKLDELFKFLLFFENIYSTGSLMEYLRISGHNWFRVKYDGNEVTYDDVFDLFVGELADQMANNSTNYINFTVGGNQYRIVPDDNLGPVANGFGISMREALELMRDDLSFVVSSVNGFDFTQITFIISNLSFNLPLSDAPLNLGRLWAYQLCVAHFYSNDHIDFIYSAELFRQYINQLATVRSSQLERVPSFSVNGMTYLYDSLSAKFFDSVYGGFTNGIFGYSTATNIPRSDSLNDAYAYFVALFGFKRSLRFQDYFTGSRAYPLNQLSGTGSPTVAVNNNAVSVIDMSRASMMTKFLQAVNRSGRKFSAYMQELFGKTPAYDYHNPMYLAHTSDLVGAQETDNTGSAQVTDQIAVTSRFRATSSRYAFEFEPDRDCIVIGISYYDLPRVYQRATDAQNFYTNRFDMFNTYLQYIGDQSISEAEIGTDTPDVSKPFSYTNRHMEYKQRYNTSCGGFCVPSTGLDNWIFPADALRRLYFHNISPSFIRSFNSELDRFYQVLSGWSLGTYFHFIVRYDNRQDASRPMAYNPPISI